MTTSDFDADTVVPADDDFAIAVEAPVADTLEQHAPAQPADEEPEALPVELPDDVNPADALDQARPVVERDDDV